MVDLVLESNDRFIVIYDLLKFLLLSSRIWFFQSMSERAGIMNRFIHKLVILEGLDWPVSSCESV